MALIDDLGPALPYAVWAFVFAAGIAFVLTPLVRLIAIRLGMVDEPDERRVNVRPVARGGGIAIVAAFVVVVLVVLALNDRNKVMAIPSTLDGPQLVALLAGGVAAALIGLIDDLLQVRARWQLIGQLVLAGWAVALGISVGFLTSPIGPSAVIPLTGAIGVAFTVFWILGMINAINFIDGLDGLSSGIALIAATTLGLISADVFGQPLITVLCLALAGALLGFLRWNFHPAAIFAGTSGTMFIGYTLALLAIVGTAKVAIALLILGVPILDTFWIIVRRLVTGRAPFSPDRGHIHHRLLDLGLSHRQAVLMIYAICVALAALSFWLSGGGQLRSQLYAFLGLFVVSGVALVVLARRSILIGGLEAESYEPEEDAGDGTDESDGDRGESDDARAAHRSPDVRASAVPATDPPSIRGRRREPHR